MQETQNRVDLLPPDPPSLARRRPHVAGVRTLTLPGSAPDRGLAVELWYPAAPGTVPGGQYETVLRDGVTAIVLRGAAARDAPMAAGDWPLVILSHGYPGNRYLMAHLGEALASQGFRVAAPDHPGSIYGEMRAFGETLLNRMGDVRAVADGLEAAAYGVIGYSMGGYGALVAAGCGVGPGALAHPEAPAPEAYARWQHPEVDPRLKAILPIGPWGGQEGIWDDEGLARLAVPMLMLAGDADTISGYEQGMLRIFCKATGAPRFLLTFQGAGHNAAAAIPAPAESFTPSGALEFFPADHYRDPVWDTVQMNAIAQHFAHAFMALHLKGDGAMARYLAGDWHGFQPGTEVGLGWQALPGPQGASTVQGAG